MLMHRGSLPWQKLTQKIAILTRACRQTVAGLLFVFVDHGAGIRRATYLCLDCAKNVDKNWSITVSFIIHVNFGHAWAEHYPVTLIWGVDSVKSTVTVLEEVTLLRRGVVSTGGGAFQLEDTTFCGGGVRFDLEEGV